MMDSAGSSRLPVLIVGAGPSGLLLAIWLQRLGTAFRIVDKNQFSADTSRALAVHARTMEFYDMLGFADECVSEGNPVEQVILWHKSKKLSTLRFEDVGRGMTKYPFMLCYPQDTHEQLLMRKLEALGVTIEREIEVVSLTQTDDQVNVVMCRKDGKEETVQASYVAGCDGFNSIVRKESTIEMPGGTYSQRFFVADCETDLEATTNAELGDTNLCFSNSSFSIIFPLPSNSTIRLIGIVPKECHEIRGHDVKFEDVEPCIAQNVIVKTTHINWFSTYHVHHRVATSFRDRRIFICGDAAHVHSPVGGQGMNTGLGDVTNLAWKLHAVLSRQSPESILDTYNTERRTFAETLVKTTDRAFSMVSDEGWFGTVFRNVVLGLVIPMLLKIANTKDRLFARTSQLALNYRSSSSLSEQGNAIGSVCAGDRMPWVESANNFAPLRKLCWQLQIFGETTQELKSWVTEREFPLAEFAFGDEAKSKGILKDAIYLLRPDGYVGFVVPSCNGSLAALETYAHKWFQV